MSNPRYGQRGYDERWDRTSETLVPTLRMQDCQRGCLVRCYYSYASGDYVCEAKPKSYCMMEPCEDLQLHVWLPIILIGVAIILGALGFCAWRAFRGGRSPDAREPRLDTRQLQYRKEPPAPHWQTTAA